MKGVLIQTCLNALSENLIFSRYIWFARDVDAMAAALNTKPILIVAREVSFHDGDVTPFPVDTTRIPNDHLQYAITWFSLAAIWLAMTFYFVQRRVIRS